MFSQNAFDRISGDGLYSKLPKVAQYSRVAPLVLSGQFDDQEADLLCHPPPSPFDGGFGASLPVLPESSVRPFGESRWWRGHGWRSPAFARSGLADSALSR